MPNEFRLYDVVADPAESRNVAGEPAYADVRANLASTLARLDSGAGSGG